MAPKKKVPKKTADAYAEEARAFISELGSSTADAGEDSAFWLDVLKQIRADVDELINVVRLEVGEGDD